MILQSAPFSQIEYCLTPAVVTSLVDAGFVSLMDLRCASDRDLLSVHGIGPKTVALIRQRIEQHDEYAVREIESMRRIVAAYDQDPWRTIDSCSFDGAFRLQ